MRIDKYLKITRVIKRRTAAQEACDGGKILVNDKEAKPSKEVKVGDIVTVVFVKRTVRFRVVAVEPPKNQKDVDTMYELLSD